MNDHDSPKENTNGLLYLATYGTLKVGHINHDRYCRGVLSVEPITIIGRLYQFPSGIPIIEVPEEHILAQGTHDPLADVATQERFAKHLAQHHALQPQDAPVGDWGRVCGELLAFNDPESRLPAIDRLEGFNPVGPCLYRRVLVQVIAPGSQVPAWLYAGLPRSFSGLKVITIGIWR
ncbi:MAG TPA: gamma-glutamylcyclotransferase family protein [bacterium]|nr:gamma-glutamylcyclotransferase family protein [bacterium]